MNRIAFVLAFFLGFVFIPASGAVVSADEAVDRFNAAKQAFDARNFAQARAGFEDFQNRYPKHDQATEATFYLAESLLNLQEYTAAEAGYSRLAALGTTNPYARVALFRLGDIPYVQGQFNIAKPRLEQFVEQLPHDTNLQFVLYYLGDIAMQAHAAPEAEHYFGQCVRMFPQGARVAESQLGLAWAKNQLGNLTEANEIYRQLINSNDPAVVEMATYQSGVAQYERGDYPAAVSTLSTFLTRWPQSVYTSDALRIMARCKGSQNDYQSALQFIARIQQPSMEDILLKIRCLYGSKQTQEAQTLLNGIERTAGAAYADEIALLKSVFMFDEQNWAGTIRSLEAILLPQYDQTTGKMMFNYATIPAPSGGHKLSDEAFMNACSLLTIAYAQNGDRAKANAALAEMQANAAMIGHSDLVAVATETANRLNNIRPQNNGNGNGNGTGIGNGIGNNNDQWVGGNGRPNTNRPNQNRPGNNQWNSNTAGPFENKDRPGNNSWNSNNTNPSNGSGQWNPNTNQNNNHWVQGNQPNGSNQGQTDLDRFWRASQSFDQKQWSEAAGLLDQLLNTQYNPWTKQFYINYSSTSGTSAPNSVLNETTLARACSLLALSRAYLGDSEQAAAIMATFAQKVRGADSIQTDLYRYTQEQVTQIARGNIPHNGFSPSSPQGNYAGHANIMSDQDQRRVLRECNSLYKSKRYDQLDAKLEELIASRPSETVLSEATLLRSKALTALGKEREAVLLLEKIVKEMPGSSEYPDALWFLGYYYEFCGDSFRAVEYFQLLADQFPNYKKIDGVLYFLAMEDLENGNGRKANTYLNRVFRNYQNGEYWSHAVWTLALEAFKKRDYSQSEMYVQKILQHPPDYAILDRVLFLKGELALHQKEYDTAFVAFREVGKLCPESPLRNDADRNAQIAGGRSVAATR